MLPQKILKIRMICLAENEFRATKFPDFSSLHRNSLTFPGYPLQVFQVAGHPDDNCENVVCVFLTCHSKC